MASRPKRSGAILAFVLLLFFASGFSALLYQTIWQRLLGFFSGVDIYSVTITVAAFMGGLGCGSLAGGQLADRLSQKHRLLAFGLAEGIIALFALGSKWLYYDLSADVRPLIANLVAGKFNRYSPEDRDSIQTDRNSDFFPKDEYMVPPRP